MLTRVLSIAARKEFQPLWWTLYRAVIGGLGFMNTSPALNGEQRYFSAWARRASRQHDRRGKTIVILDVGANEGDFTAYAIHSLEEMGVDNFEVHCFEPNPETFYRLKQRFEGDERVIVKNLGVGSEPGYLKLYDEKSGVGTGHASFLYETFSDIFPVESKSVEVEVTTIDDYLAVSGLSEIDYLKVDVEGFEKFVFQGMKAGVEHKRYGVVQFEFNAHNAVTGLTLLQVGGLFPGYQIHKLLPNGTEPQVGGGVAYNSRMEIFKYSNYVAVCDG